MQIRIQDKRRGVFTVDNVVLNHYGQAMGATGIAVYVTLCRYANNQTQQCFPSLTTIQNEVGMSRHGVIETLKRLEQLQLITKRTKLRKATIYTLLEPLEDGVGKLELLKGYYQWLYEKTGAKKTLDMVKKTEDELLTFDAGAEKTPPGAKSALNLVQKDHPNELMNELNNEVKFLDSRTVEPAKSETIDSTREDLVRRGILNR